MSMMKDGVWSTDNAGNPIWIPNNPNGSWTPTSEKLDGGPQQVQTHIQTRQPQQIEQPVEQPIQQPMMQQRYSWAAPEQPIRVPSWIAQSQSGTRFPPISPFEVRIRQSYQNTQGHSMFRPLTIGRDTPFGSYRRPESFFRPLTSNVLSQNTFGSRLFPLQQYTETEIDNVSGEIINQRKIFFRPRAISKI